MLSSRVAARSCQSRESRASARVGFCGRRACYRDRIRFIEGRGVSYAHTFPYWPIRDLLREWLGVGASTLKHACASS